MTTQIDGQGQLEPPVREPHELGDDAIVLAGLAETLCKSLGNAYHENGIYDAENIAWAYKALAQLASTLAERISGYAP